MVEQTGVSLSYLWQPSGRGLAIKLNLGAVDRIAVAVRSGVQLLPQRGLEIGGVLLGRTERSQGRTTVWIEGFELLDCEHAVGPSFILSGEDRQGLAMRLRQYSGGDRRVVGFFRSHTRKDFGITPEDADLMREYFPKSWMVFLLVRCGTGIAERAGYLLWNEGALHPRPDHEFPCSSELLLKGNYEISDEAKPLQPAKPAMLGSAATHAAAVKTADQAVRTAMRQTWSCVKKWQQKLLRTSGRQLPLQWLFAGGILAGVLSAYVAQHHQAGGPAQAAQRPAIVQQTASGAMAAPVFSATEPQTAEQPESGGDPAPTRVSNSVHGVAHRVAEVRTFHAEPATSPDTVAEAAPLPPPPSLDMPPGDDVGSANLAGILSPPPMHVAEPWVRVSVDSTPHARQRGLLRRVFKHEQDADYSPPKVVHEEPLELPTNLRDQVGQHPPISVKVYIDAAGNVQYVELLSDGTGRNRELASLAVFTARHFEFTPAREGNETVPAQVVLRFDFGSEAGEAEARRKSF